VGYRALQLCSLFAAFALVRCVRGAGATEHRDAATQRSAVDRASQGLAEASPQSDAAQDAHEPRGIRSASELPFVAHAVERCYLDRLAGSEYLHDWVRAGGLERAVPAGDPVPSPSLSLPSWGPRPQLASSATPMVLLSGAFFPVRELPSTLATIAELLPSTALVEACRAALDPTARTLAAPMITLVVWAVVALSLGVWRFDLRRMG